MEIGRMVVFEGFVLFLFRGFLANVHGLDL